MSKCGRRKKEKMGLVKKGRTCKNMLRLSRACRDYSALGWWVAPQTSVCDHINSVDAFSYKGHQLFHSRENSNDFLSSLSTEKEAGWPFRAFLER